MKLEFLMRKMLLLLLLSSLCFPLLVGAQGFHKVFSPNGVDVWAVGNGGRLFRSYDGGDTWGMLTLTNSTLRSVNVRGSRLLVGADNGKLFRSNDGGSNWDSTSFGSALLSILFPTNNLGFIVGGSGTILRSTDGGTSWSNVSSPITRTLNAIAFTDSTNGWIVGDSGSVLRTTNRGITWNPVSVGLLSTNLTSVGAVGSTISITGRDATVIQSRNSGTSWFAIDFKIESKSDVNKVVLMDPATALYCGGGGFIRKTTDGGTNFSFQKNPMLANLSDLFFFDGQRGWGCSDRTNAIVRTTNGGATWLLPAGTSVNYSWTQKLSAGSSTVRGNTFAINPLDKRTIYVVLGTRVYASHDVGETWTAIGSPIPNGTKTSSFYVSPTDTNLFVAAFGAPDGIKRSTDYGSTWTTPLTRAFTEYGMPLEMDPKNPNNLFFGPEDGYLYKSTNFGLTWDTLSRPNFRSPCDLVVVYEKPDNMFCGDGVTGSGSGQIFTSADAGRSWSLVQTVTGSEIPTIGSSWLDNSLAYATAWSTGGVRKTTDTGNQWPQVHTAGSAWGVDISKDDPNVVMFGVYGGSTSYLSTDGGQNWITSSLAGSNYAILGYDRSTFLAQQSGGVFKYTITYTVPVSNLQTLAVVQPAAGSVWLYNTTRNITWSSGNLTNLRIEYKTSPTAPWQLIVASTPASAGSYAWTVPNTPTSLARVRISDATDGVPADSSALFAIASSALYVSTLSLNFDTVAVGFSRGDTLRITNAGTATLVLSSLTTRHPSFAPGRSSFSIPPGGSDTLTVTFGPLGAGVYRDSLRIVSNSPDSISYVALFGVGSPPVSVGEGRIAGMIPSSYHLFQNYPNPFNPTTMLSFDIPVAGHVMLTVYNMLGQLVRTAANGYYQPGRYEAQFDALTLPSGLYFYRLSTAQFSDTKRMMLLK